MKVLALQPQATNLDSCDCIDHCPHLPSLWKVQTIFWFNILQPNENQIKEKDTLNYQLLEIILNMLFFEVCVFITVYMLQVVHTN